jgi:hypothetical protein
MYIQVRYIQRERGERERSTHTLIYYTYNIDVLGQSPTDALHERVEVHDHHPRSGMYPPPHVTCMYPPPPMTCIMMILDQGLRREDVGAAMDKIPWPGVGLNPKP